MTENNDTAKKKFSLVELLMIIMLVGIVFTITIPFHQSQKEHQMVKEAIRNLQIIAHENVKFFNNPENGYYAFDLSMLDVNEKLTTLPKHNKYYFEYSLTDSTVVATSNENFGKEGIQIFYYLPSGPMSVADDALSREIVDPNWLP